jgi:DNA-binding PucR family transcriptional regulator
VYAVLAADSAVDLMSDFMERFGHSDRVVVGVGPPVAQPRDLGQSRTVADQVAEALLRRRRTGVVETLASAWVDVLVDRLEPMLAAHPGASPLTRLVEHDHQHRADLVETVATYLELGDVSRTASALHVHPNTLRNRLRRAREQCAVDLADPDTRLALMIALRARSRPTP